MPLVVTSDGATRLANSVAPTIGAGKETRLRHSKKRKRQTHQIERDVPRYAVMVIVPSRDPA